MVQPKAPTHLVLRGNTYHFRLKFPQAVRLTSGTKEVQLTLKTSYFRVAVYRANLLFAHASKIFKEFSWMEHGEINKLVKSHLKGLLAKDFEKRVMEGDSYEFQFPGPDGNMLSAEDALREFYPFIGNYSSWGDPTVRRFTKEMFTSFGMDISEDSREFKYAEFEHKKLLKPFLTSIKVRRNPMDYDFVRCELEDEQTETSQVAPVANCKSNPAHTLSSVFEKYSNERIIGKAWKETSARRNRDNFNWLLDHLGDIPIDSITDDMMRGFKDMLMSANTKNTVKNDKKIKSGTINNILSSIRAFFKFAKTNKYIKENPAECLLFKTKKTKGDSYEKFTMEDLNLIFTAKSLDGRKGTKAWRFWIPVLAYFTGCRLEEIAQLLCSDIKCENGVWYLDLKEEGDKSLKTVSSERKVPIHHILIEQLKFLQFVENVKSAGHDRLFHDLKKVGCKYGHALSNWFNDRYLKEVGARVHGDKKVFHSLRHTFIANLLHQGVEPNLLASIVGHEPDLITVSVYGLKFKLEQQIEAIEKLNYGIDIEGLARSKFVIR